MDSAQLSFPALTATLKAAGEATRLRLLMLIAEAIAIGARSRRVA